MRTITVTTKNGARQSLSLDDLYYLKIVGGNLVCGNPLVRTTIRVPGDQVASLDISREQNENVED